MTPVTEYSIFRRYLLLSMMTQNVPLTVSTLRILWPQATRADKILSEIEYTEINLILSVSHPSYRTGPIEVLMIRAASVYDMPDVFWALMGTAVLSIPK